jgi:hypothetical protein
MLSIRGGFWNLSIFIVPLLFCASAQEHWPSTNGYFGGRAEPSTPAMIDLDVTS